MRKVLNEKPLIYADLVLPAFSIGNILSTYEASEKDAGFVRRWNLTELPKGSYVYIVWEDDPRQRLRVFNHTDANEGSLLPYKEPTLWECLKTTVGVALDRNPFTAIVGLPILALLSFGDWRESKK